VKIQVVSDMHFEMFPRRSDDLDRFYERLTGGVKKSGAILCIAGDLGVLHRPETWIEPLKILARRFRAVVLVAGNHEFYGNCMLGQEKRLAKVFDLPANVHFLFNSMAMIDGVQYIGGTLWTSFYSRGAVVMGYAASRINDFRLISHKDGSTLTPDQTVDMHQVCKKYIFRQIRAAKARSEKTVVLTHHCISPKSVHLQYAGNPLNAAFFTDLTEEITLNGPDLWVHGHTHNSFDYMLGSTRVVCNPFGYLHREENPDFDCRLKIKM
jgi:UDP-2,3-diacylglucosamine pyrophosphatase LpxH